MAHKIFDTTCSDQKLLLSICILSYNQPEEIQRVLISLQVQVMVGVEIVILDDSENDETEILARRFSATLPIRYFHGKKKGVDEAVLFLTHAAKGDFIWWMGDDEITSGGVYNVLKIIEADKKINFIWI
jgi:glycosyltransferase involved in cell wall biosynthesis